MPHTYEISTIIQGTPYIWNKDYNTGCPYIGNKYYNTGCPYICNNQQFLELKFQTFWNYENMGYKQGV